MQGKYIADYSSILSTVAVIGSPAAYRNPKIAKNQQPAWAFSKIIQHKSLS